MSAKVDLHTHSFFSDGIFSPEEVIKKARDNRIRFLGLTDHDTIAGLPRAIKHGKKLGLEIVPGVELSCNLGNREVHILGYYFYLPGELQNTLRWIRNKRFSRAYKMVELLTGLRYFLTMDELLFEAGKAAPGRLHLARLMLKKGHVSSTKEAFDNYLNPGKPAYVPRQKLDYRYGINLLKKSTAVTMLAHPGSTSEDASTIKLLIETGIDGLEVFHPHHDQEQIEYYSKLAKEENLLVGGGTDFHGDYGGSPGDIYISYNNLLNIKHRKKKAGYSA